MDGRPGAVRWPCGARHSALPAPSRWRCSPIRCPRCAGPCTHCAAAHAAMMVRAIEFALDQAVRARPRAVRQTHRQQPSHSAATGATGWRVRQRTHHRAGGLPRPALAAPGRRAQRRVQHGRGQGARWRGGQPRHRHRASGARRHCFTDGHALNFATRRLWTWRSDLGGASWWAERLGSAFIAGGAEGFWPGLTKRQAPAPLALS